MTRELAYGESQTWLSVQLGSQMMADRLMSRYYRLAQKQGRAEVEFFPSHAPGSKRWVVLIHTTHRAHNKNNVWCDPERAVIVALRDLSNQGAPPRYHTTRVDRRPWRALPCPSPACTRSVCIREKVAS
jgi:hypothetical protein